MTARQGRFVWFDLMTPDVPAAKRFYAETAGWKTSTWPGSNYEMWSADEQMLGGVMPLSADELKSGTPPRWLGYVSVEDVDTTVQRAQKLGGRVTVPPTDIPDTGRYAILADAQGATFGIYKSNHPGPLLDPQKVGHFAWAELNTTDWKSAWKFYSELFGWKKTQSITMPEFGEYFMFGTDPGSPIGGMSDVAIQMKAPAHWLYYLRVKSADETAKAIVPKGGSMMTKPEEVPGGDRVAQCADPQGAMFGIISSPS
jgi:uncharacterized protein